MNHQLERPPHIKKHIHRQRAFYTIEWSPLKPVDRHAINSAVPSLPGIWELYWLENSRIPRLLKMGRAWYGGLRNELRIEADATELRNREIAEQLAGGDSYYRFTVCESAPDLEEVYDVLTTLREVPSPASPPQRYKEVRIQEPDEMVIHRNRTPAAAPKPPTPFGNTVPNMFDVMAELREIDRAEQREIRQSKDPSGSS